MISQRKKISEDLNEDLTSSLVALKYYIEDESAKLSSIDAKQELKKISDEMAIIQDNANKYMLRLWEGELLKDYDLMTFLKTITKKFSGNSSLSIVLKVDERKVSECLNTQQQDQLYHIINECVSNAIKHSQASKIIISLRFEENDCYFSFSDNGLGFRDKPGLSGGLGLRSMKKRMAALKGKLSIQSTTDGTQISSTFPLLIQIE